MGGISTAIELQDNFTGIMMNIINAIHMSVSAVEQMQSVMEGTIDTSSIEQANEAVQALNDTLQNMESPSVISPAIDYGNIQPTAGRSMMEAPDAVQIPVQAVVTEQPQMDVSDNLIVPVEPVVTEQPTVEIPNEVIAKQQCLNELMDHVSPQNIDIILNLVVSDPLVENTEVAVPVRWQSDNLKVFTNAGMERFKQEAQKTYAMLQQLSSTQNAIARQAYNANIFLPEAFQNLNAMADWIDNIRERIQQVESNPLDMRMNAANSQLEQLRVQLNQVMQVQELMNRAVQNMDVRAANEAYLRQLQIIGNTQRNIQNNVDEQSCFNDVIQKGVDGVTELKNRIVDTAKAIIKMDIKKLKDWAVDGITKGAADLIESSTVAFNTQLNTEIRRMSVLASMLDEEYVAQFAVEVSADTIAAVDEINALQNNLNGVTVPVTAEVEALTAAYAQITGKASEIQGRGVFRDEAMIAGAVKLSMYFSDQEAVMAIMDTLSDYAMGMNVLEGKGLTIDVNSMVGYATDLGKIMSGTYTAMSQKGFNFSDAQKAVIEGTATEVQIVEALGAEYLDMSADMQAAAVIDSVIGGAWEGLYEIMSNTPEGKIIQMINTWGGMKEVVGGQLYPYVLLFVDAITQNWGTIQTVLDNITFGLQVMLGVLSWLMEGAINFAQAVIDNWGWIRPIIYGIIGALAVYNAYLAITKGLELANKAAKVVMIVAEYAHAAATRTAVSATTAEAAAQMGLNTAFLACPITWIIIAIIALIAIIYAAVAALNKGKEETISAAGIICGFVASAGAFLLNTAIGIINAIIQVVWSFAEPFIGFVEWILNVANGGFDSFGGKVANLIGQIISWFLSLGMVVTKIIDAIFGTDWTSGLSELQDNVLSWGKNENAITLERSAPTIDYRMSYGDAWNVGYSFGEGIDESIANFDLLSLFDITDIPPAEDYASALAGGGIGSGVDDIAGNTGAMADAMDITEEELKYLRDIAEQETINRFTTAEIHLEQTNHNTIKNSMDLDGIMSGMTDMMNEAIDISTEGVHV